MVDIRNLGHVFLLLHAAFIAAISFIETDVSLKSSGARRAPDIISFFEARYSGGAFDRIDRNQAAETVNRRPRICVYPGRRGSTVSSYPAFNPAICNFKIILV